MRLKGFCSMIVVVENPCFQALWGLRSASVTGVLMGGERVPI